jgi:hypothetical protein
MNYEEDLNIDMQNLDQEWLAQPNLFMRYAREAKRLRKEAVKAEERVKSVRSKLILEANREGIPGIDKITDTKVEAYYRDHPKYKEAVEARIEAEDEAEVADQAIFACHQRKAALENLVTLWSQEYFSEPREPKGTRWSERVEEKGEEELSDRQQAQARARKRSRRTTQ